MATQAKDVNTGGRTSSPNEVLSNKILSTTFVVTEGKGRKAKTVKYEIGQFRIKDEDGDGYNVIDIMQEALGIQTEIDIIKKKAANFASHMMLLASSCASPDQFRQLLHVAEESIRWGTAPKGSSAKERAMYRAAPQTYQDYKSRILKAWENGVIPGKTYSVETRAKGVVKTITQAADSPAIMAKIARQKLEKVAEKEERKQQGQQAGVEVKPDGSMEEHTPKIKAEDVKVMAACIDIDLAALLSRTLELFENAPTADQTKALDTINRLNNRLASVQKSDTPEESEESKAA